MCKWSGCDGCDVELYEHAADDSVNRNGEEEQPGYHLFKNLACLTSWTNYFFGLTNTSHRVCMFLKGYNVATVTLDVMLNCPLSFISKLLGNKQCLVASLSEVSWNVFPMLSESHRNVNSMFVLKYSVYWKKKAVNKFKCN